LYPWIIPPCWWGGGALQDTLTLWEDNGTHVTWVGGVSGTTNVNRNRNIYIVAFFVRTQFLILTIPPSCVVPTMGALAGPLAMLLKALIEMSYFVNFLKPVSCTFVVAQPFTVKLLLWLTPEVDDECSDHVTIYPSKSPLQDSFGGD